MRIALAITLLAAAVPAAAGRPFVVDDLLSMRSYGQVVAAPAAGLLLVERRRPYREAPGYGQGGYFVDRALDRIMSLDLATPRAGLRDLFPQADDAGYWIGSLSPSGMSASVFRLRRGVLALGVVRLKTGAVRWLDARPDLLSRDPAPAWLSESRILVAELPAGRTPRLLRLGSAAGARMASLYAEQAAGRDSWTAISTSARPARAGSSLVEIDVGRSRRREVTRGDIVDFAVSRDRRSVAVVMMGTAVPPPPSPIGVSFAARRRTLRVVPLAGGDPVEIAGDFATGVLRWSDDGRLLAVARDADASTWRAARLLAVDTRGRVSVMGRPGDIPHAVEPADGLRFSAWWTGPTVIASVRDRGRVQWRRLVPGRSRALPVPADATVRAGDGRDVLLASAETTWLVGPLRSERLPAGERPLVATSLDPFAAGDRLEAGPCPRVSVTGPTTDGAHRRPARSCAHGALSGADDDVLAAVDAGLVLRTVDPHGVERLELARRGGARFILDEINSPMSGIELPEMIRLETVDATGRPLSHWLLLPRRATAGRRPPLVVQPYPGRVFGAVPPPDARPWRHGTGSNALLLVGAGFAVLLPGMPRPDGSNPIGRVADQVWEAVLAARRTGRVDATRPGVMGHSFGAWTALVLAERLPCVGPVVAANGVYDLVASHATMAGPDRVDLELGVTYSQSAGWTEAGQGAMMATPWDAPNRYLAASPLLRAPLVRAPVLLVAGDLDAVDMAQSERMFMELGRVGGAASLLRFWGEGHTVSSPRNLRTYWSAAVAFLAHGPDGVAGAGPGGAGLAIRSGGGRVDGLHAEVQASQAATNMSDRKSPLCTR